MQRQNAGGFTIIEVMIFLAISALMITIALAGTGTAIRSARFSDSVRSFEAHMQKQFDDTLNGLNSRDGSQSCDSSGIDTTIPSIPGTSNDCLLLGKYIHVVQGANVVDSYYVIGSPPASGGVTDSDALAIIDAQPRVVLSSKQSYEIPWGALIYDTKRGTGQRIDGIALIRSPRSSSIYTYTFPLSANVLTTGTLTGALLSPANTNQQANVCIRAQESDGVVGAVTMARNGRGQDAINSRIDLTGGPSGTAAAECNGV